MASSPRAAVQASFACLGLTTLEEGEGEDRGCLVKVISGSSGLAESLVDLPGQRFSAIILGLSSDHICFGPVKSKPWLEIDPEKIAPGAGYMLGVEVTVEWVRNGRLGP